MTKKEKRLLVLRTFCQIFALSEDEKWRYLEGELASAPFVVNDANDVTNEPLKFCCHAAFELTEHFRDLEDRVLYDLVHDIGTLLTLMIESTYYSYIWQNPKLRVISGPADRLWNILRRMAVQILAHCGWEAGSPEIPLSRITFAGTLKDDD